jgi:hypothetical protein
VICFQGNHIEEYILFSYFSIDGIFKLHWPRQISFITNMYQIILSPSLVSSRNNQNHMEVHIFHNKFWWIKFIINVIKVVQAGVLHCRKYKYIKLQRNCFSLNFPQINKKQHWIKNKQEKVPYILSVMFSPKIIWKMIKIYWASLLDVYYLEQNIPGDKSYNPYASSGLSTSLSSFPRIRKNKARQRRGQTKKLSDLPQVSWG